MKNKLSLRLKNLAFWIAACCTIGLYACNSQVEAADASIADLGDETAAAVANGISENPDFNSFLRNFPDIQLPHEVNPKEPNLNAIGGTMQGLPPKGVTSFLDVGNEFLVSAYGKYTIQNQIVLIYQRKEPGSKSATYFARSFSKNGNSNAVQEIAKSAVEKQSSWTVYGKLTSDGIIRSHGYASDLKTDELLKESYACYAISDQKGFAACEVPPGTSFLGLFKSPKPVDGDGGYDVYRFSTYVPEGEDLPKIALSRCYQNGDGQIDQCREVGLVTKEISDAEGHKLIIDDITGEMVPTYIVTKGKQSTWSLAAHWYDVDSDRWIDNSLESIF